MVVEFQVREAINSLVALLRVAEDSAVHHYEQDDAFHPGIFPGLILLARLAADRAGEEFRQAVAAAEQIRKLNESCDELRYVTTDRDTFRDGLHELKKEFDQLQQQLAQVTAERDAARQKQLEEHVEWASFYNGLQANLDTVKAERDAARKQRDQLRERLAEIDRAVAEAMQAPTNAETLRRLRALDNKSFELSGNSGELPAGPVFTMEAFDRAVEFYNACLKQSAEPAPEPDQWQNGDTVRHVERLPSDVPYTVKRLSCGRVALIGLTGMLSQADWEKHGFELHRRASDPPPSPQQVAEFAEATEPIDDSVGADGEGQS